MKTGSFLSSKTCFLFSFVFFTLLLGLSNSGRGQARLMIGDAGSGKKDPGVQVAAANTISVAMRNQTSAKTISSDAFVNEPIPGHEMNAPLASKIASVSGPWSSTTTWGGSAVPTSADAVTINSGITVTVDVANAQCASLTFAAVAASSAVTISGSNSLTITGLLSMPRPSSGQTCTMNVNAGTLSCGYLSMAAIGAGRPDLINITTGVFTITGDIACSSNTGGVSNHIFQYRNIEYWWCNQYPKYSNCYGVYRQLYRFC